MDRPVASDGPQEDDRDPSTSNLRSMNIQQNISNIPTNDSTPSPLTQNNLTATVLPKDNVNTNNSNPVDSSQPASKMQSTTTTPADASIAVGASSSSSRNPNNETKQTSENTQDSIFECNVCFDTAREPVITQCGHLYCWPCLYRWMKLHENSPQCPVCKSAISKSKTIPMYGRGRTESDPRNRIPPRHDDDVPPRPQGHHEAPPRNGIPLTSQFGLHHSQYGAFAFYGPNYDQFATTGFGLFPGFLGRQMAYMQPNDRPDEDNPPNPDEGFPELVAKVFVFLAILIAFFVTTF